MDRPFYCPDCGTEHDEPSDARLGHQVPCFDCALASGVNADRVEAADIVPPIAA